MPVKGSMSECATEIDRGLYANRVSSNSLKWKFFKNLFYFLIKESILWIKIDNKSFMKLNICKFLSILAYMVGVLVLSNASNAWAQDRGYGYYQGPGPQPMHSAPPAMPSAFDGINYDLLEMGYRYLIFDGDKSLLDDGHAISLDLSLDLLWLFFVEAEVLYGSTNAELDTDKFFDLDESGNYTEIELGIGGHIPVSDRFDIVASGGFFYENQDLSGDVVDDVDGIIDGGGVYLRPGVRFLITDSLEAGAFAEYTKLTDADDGNWGVGGNLTFRATDAIGITGSVHLKEDVSTLGVGLRLSW